MEFIALFLLPMARTPAMWPAPRQQAQRTRIAQGDLPVTLSGGLVLLDAGEELDAAMSTASELL